MGIQILVTALSAYIVVKAMQNYRRKNISLSMTFVWTLLWLGMIALVWQPSLTDSIAGLLRVGRGADAVFYLSLILIFYLLFRLFVRFEHLDTEITTLTRELAILEREHKESAAAAKSRIAATE